MRRGHVLLLLVLLGGCSKSDPHFPGYAKASGDVVPFILQSATALGARPWRTNSLAPILAEWRYKADRDGIQICLTGDHFAEVQSMLQTVFGTPSILPRTNQQGHVIMGVYAAASIGAAIQFTEEDQDPNARYTGVLIVRAGALSP